MTVKDAIKVMTMALYNKDYQQVETLANLLLSDTEQDINNLKSSDTRYIDVSDALEFMLLDKYYFSDIKTELCKNDYGKIFYLQANALSSMGRYEEAKKAIEEALYWSPINSKYLAEYYFVLQKFKEWEKCLEVLSTMGKYTYKSKDFALYLRNMGYLMCEYKKDYAAAIGFYAASLDYEESKVAFNEINYIGKQVLFVENILNKYTSDEWKKSFDIAASYGAILPSKLVVDEIISNIREAHDKGRVEIEKYFLLILKDLKIIKE